MKASDYVARYLEYRGVTHTFELVGGMITHLLDSISNVTKIKIVSCHHEQAAAFAAEAVARISGVPGIALATSGPGATNLLTAIGSCYYDSVPAVFITGQVNTFELKGNKNVRQLGFQETNIVSMAAPITKSSVLIKSIEELPQALHEAFELSLNGRQGPCLVDIPMNIQAEHITDELAAEMIKLIGIASSRTLGIRPNAESTSVNLRLIEQLLCSIAKSDKPLLLMGGGCSIPNNRKASRQIIDLLNIPVVFSLMGVDILPSRHPLRVGFIGSYGNRWANKILAKADLLVVIGSRLDIRQTGSDIQSFCKDKEIWQIDIDSEEIGLRLVPSHRLCCSVRYFGEELAKVKKKSPECRDSWNNEILELKAKYPAASEYASGDKSINPIVVLEKLSMLLKHESCYVTDVGQHQMWAAQSLNFSEHDRFLTSGGMGAMGFGLPASIGAAFKFQGKNICLITGDGSFQLNIQELETVMRNSLDIKILLFNNKCHGMVRQFQESYFQGRLQSSSSGYSAPDFTAVASAYGVSTRRVDLPEEVDESLYWLTSVAGSALLEVHIAVDSKVYPKLAFGRAFGDMEPEMTPVAMEST